MHQQKPAADEKSSQFLGVPTFWVAISGLSSAVTLPIRYGEGLTGAGRSGFFAVLVIFVYALAAPCPPLLNYGLLFIGVVVFKRVTSLCRHHFGRREMSGFEGYPLVCLIGLPYGFAKQVLEPALVGCLGWYLRQSDLALGNFFLAGALAAGFKTLLERAIQLNRDLTANDLRIQMEIDARRRARRGW